MYIVHIHIYLYMNLSRIYIYIPILLLHIHMYVMYILYTFSTLKSQVERRVNSVFLCVWWGVGGEASI